jgi:hypothetical protein
MHSLAGRTSIAATLLLVLHAHLMTSSSVLRASNSAMMNVRSTFFCWRPALAAVPASAANNDSK